MLPTALCMLPRLTSLDLSHNGTMTDLPEAFAQLTSLKEIVVKTEQYIHHVKPISVEKHRRLPGTGPVLSFAEYVFARLKAVTRRGSYHAVRGRCSTQNASRSG